MKVKGAISVAILVGFLIGAPAISYLYLNEGMKYRIQARKDLISKGSVLPFQLTIDSSLVLSNDDLKGKVSVLSRIKGTAEDWNFLAALYNQYKSRKEFEMWTFCEKIDLPNSIPDVTEWKKIEMNSIGFESFVSNSFNATFPKGEKHILIDTARNVRYVYNLPSKEEEIRLIEHIAIVLPRTKDSDIIYEVSNKKE